MKGALEILRPLLTARGIEPVGRVVIGTVKGDLHDIGKGLVASMLQGGGFEVVDSLAWTSPLTASSPRPKKPARTSSPFRRC